MDSEKVKRLTAAVQQERLVETALKMIAIPSPTGSAGVVSDTLAAILEEDGFAVERPSGGHSPAPAVVVRYDTGKPGRCLEFDGHLDTVHLPFVAPERKGDLITGSGASDMKAGVAAAVEALRALRDADVLEGGSVLLVAHDLHEAPWGLGQQLDQLIRDGIVGDAVLIPESTSGHLPVRGRGNATWRITLQRDGEPVHEVMRPHDQPNVIEAGAELVRQLLLCNEQLQSLEDAIAGRESMFVGQIHAGEIYNQYPKECWIEGTRRWLPSTDPDRVEQAFHELVREEADRMRVSAVVDYKRIRGAFDLDRAHPIVGVFQEACRAQGCGPLPEGPKPYVDDGNSFWALADVPAITHGPKAAGQHTLQEWVSIEDLVRVARVYATTALGFCGRRVS